MRESDFIDAIRESPEDPALRLVYADWLDDADDPHGEFMRVQIEIEEGRMNARTDMQHLLQREEELLKAHGKQWKFPLHLMRCSNVRFKRGAIHHVDIDYRQLRGSESAINEHAPLLASIGIRGLQSRFDEDIRQCLSQLPAFHQHVKAETFWKRFSEIQLPDLSTRTYVEFSLLRIHHLTHAGLYTVLRQRHGVDLVFGNEIGDELFLSARKYHDLSISHETMHEVYIKPPEQTIPLVRIPFYNVLRHRHFKIETPHRDSLMQATEFIGLHPCSFEAALYKALEKGGEPKGPGCYVFHRPPIQPAYSHCLLDIHYTSSRCCLSLLPISWLTMYTDAQYSDTQIPNGDHLYFQLATS